MKKVTYILIIICISFMSINVKAQGYIDNNIIDSAYDIEYSNDYINIEVPQELIDEYEEYSKNNNDNNTNIEIPNAEGITTVSITDATYSSVEQGYVTPVKNQIQTGSCWAHSGLSVLETAAIKSGYATKDLNLSEMHLVYGTNASAFSDKEIKNRYYLGGPLSNTYNGGNSIMTAAYLFSGIGAVKDELFPLKNYSEYSKTDIIPVNSSNREKQITTQEFESIPSKPEFYINQYLRAYGTVKKCNESVDDMKKMVLNYGSAQVSVNWQNSYVHNTYYFANTATTSTNHAITIVGWDDTVAASKFGFTDETKTGAWLIKNSWGTSRGNKGYYYVSYYDNTICNSYATFNGIDTSEYDYVYDSSGMYYSSNLYGITNKTVYQASIFENEGSNEKLKKVAFAVTPGYTYTAYYAPYKDGAWKTNSSGWTNLGTLNGSNVNYYGIQSIDVSNSNIKINEKYVIIVKGTRGSSSGYTYVPIVYKDARFRNNSISTIKMELKEDENYYSTNGSTWNDMYNYSYTINVQCDTDGDGKTDGYCPYSSTEEYDGAQNMIYAYTMEDKIKIEPTIIDSNNNPSSNFYSFDNSKFVLDITNLEYTLGSNYSKILNDKNEDVTNNFDVTIDKNNNKIIITNKPSAYLNDGTYSFTLYCSLNDSSNYTYKIISTLNVSKSYEIDSIDVNTDDKLIYNETPFNIKLKNYASTLANQYLTYNIKNKSSDVTNQFNINYSNGTITVQPKTKFETGNYTFTMSINGNEVQTIDFEVHTAYTMNYTPVDDNISITLSNSSTTYTVEELNNNITSVFGYSILNKNNEVITPTNIGTGMKLKVNTSKTTSNIYTFIIPGDLNGDGTIQLGDVSALYNHYRGNRLLVDAYLEAGKLTGNNTVSLGDISKLYNFYRGNISL